MTTLGLVLWGYGLAVIAFGGGFAIACVLATTRGTGRR